MAKENKWDKKIDVLIVGSGFAGLAAAIEAKQAGKNVVVIEKMKSAGGNSIISDGGIAAPETELQKSYGILDSPKLMYEDMLTAGLGLNHPKLVDTLVTKAKEAFEWTINELQVPYMDRVDIFGGHSVARCYTPEGITGATMIKRMVLKLQALDIPIEYSTSLQSILLDENKQVIGAKLLCNFDYKSGQGQVQDIKVRKGIILASGGYGADVDFRSIQDPRLDAEVMTTNKPFAKAEVLKESLRIGAGSVHLSQIQLGAWASPDEKGMGHGPLFADYILFQYGIIIDPETGKRVVNELGDRKMLSDTLLKIGHPCVGLADQTAVDIAGWDISKAIKKKVVRTFETFDDLAAFYGIDRLTLGETLNLYNSYVVKGVDSDYGKAIVEQAKIITRPPFYVMRLWPKVHFTMGGLLINEKAQVLDYNKVVIKGLYAAGEVVGGVHGASRLGSCAVTECIVFGRIAGKLI